MAKQKHIIPVRNGEKLELTVDSQGSSGDGICRYEGYTIFVPGGLPGNWIINDQVQFSDSNLSCTKFIKESKTCAVTLR